MFINIEPGYSEAKSYESYWLIVILLLITIPLLLMFVDTCPGILELSIDLLSSRDSNIFVSRSNA